MTHNSNLSQLMNFPVCLAPMVGLSHVATRILVRKYLPEGARTIWPTEMLNSMRLQNQVMGSTPLTLKHESEQGLVPQILGNEQGAIQGAVKNIENWGASGVDINMGCPVKKALRHNYGVALMGDANYAARVVEMTTKSTSLPVSVKLRAGHQKDLDYLIEFAQGLVDAGAQWLTLHPRTSAQKRRGRADWSQIKYLKQNISVPVIGNGDVQTVEDIHKMLDETGCDAVMVGRALLARPWMLQQFATGQAMSALEEGREYGSALKYLLQKFREYFPENIGVRKYHFYLRHSHVWLTYGHQLHSQIINNSTYDDIQKTLDVFFSRPRTMSQKTNLRI